ncbi:hypothetical protein ThvES_00011770 [Thiovulum sp. ES]|nr:hypothetical protein ThvES_00011770 [Thiovulum sp. ES]
MTENELKEFVDSLSENELQELKNEIDKRVRKNYFRKFFNATSLQMFLFVVILEFLIEVIVEILFD